MIRLTLNRPKKPRALGVLLCYNDADILEDVIKYLTQNNHSLVVWDHGSDDSTSEVLDKYEDILLERKYIPRSFDFYKLYPAMSQNIIDNYIDDYDWVSWPDQDEILEGPNRRFTYYEHITKVYNSGYNWIQFNNFNYWFTEKDNLNTMSPVERIKYYSIFRNVSPRIRSWRASVTNIREFNHNPLDGERYPELFNLRHYPMRSKDQMEKRVKKDRAGIKRGKQNHHYETMSQRLDKMIIRSDQLYFDNGTELNHNEKFNWDSIYR